MWPPAVGVVSDDTLLTTAPSVMGVVLIFATTVGPMTKRVLLTGASTGIGNATLQRLVAEGHEVTTLDVKDAPDGAAQHYHCDISDPASVDSVVDQLAGPFDALGNIAGVAGSMGRARVARECLRPAPSHREPVGGGQDC
jgi:hypothetical protein